MLQNRPRIRMDGVYICKFHYVRVGLSETSEYRPAHDVYSYKYIRFLPNGRLVSVYTVMPPKKFVPKLTAKVLNLLEMGENSKNNNDDFNLQTGSY